MIVVLTLLGGLVVLFLDPHNRGVEFGLRGKAAKNFSFTVDGKSERLSDFRGKVVVLNFWASWCAPCVEETPSLVQLQKRIAPRGGTILGVSLDDDQGAYLNFLKTYKIDFPTYRDATKRSALEFGTTKYPETYIIDRQGRIDRKLSGPQDWANQQMVVYMDSVLNEK